VLSSQFFCLPFHVHASTELTERPGNRWFQRRRHRRPLVAGVVSGQLAVYL